jgi:hypothetical protein
VSYADGAALATLTGHFFCAALRATSWAERCIEIAHVEMQEYVSFFSSNAEIDPDQQRSIRL